MLARLAKQTPSPGIRDHTLRVHSCQHIRVRNFPGRLGFVYDPHISGLVDAVTSLGETVSGSLKLGDNSPEHHLLPQKAPRGVIGVMRHGRRREP
jgi:hypothetical protein